MALKHLNVLGTQYDSPQSLVKSVVLNSHPGDLQNSTFCLSPLSVIVQFMALPANKLMNWITCETSKMCDAVSPQDRNRDPLDLVNIEWWCNCWTVEKDRGFKAALSFCPHLVSRAYATAYINIASSCQIQKPEPVKLKYIGESSWSEFVPTNSSCTEEIIVRAFYYECFCKY